MKLKLKKIFIKTFGKKVSITKNSNINNTLGWDSLGHIKLISEVEKILKKKLTMKQILNMTNVKSIEKILSEKN
mgnify:CR=1 FL=1